ncbi:MAG: GspE/PulE family protein [Gammaproteobacteria bacterium]|nr:type II/IV secretion system protein [Rhodocyclaceae bacterium]MBU3910331.1 GspE/PulE family protein [Gammaproteobacteria bacterium]MBU3990261.1 GspE/PulE family protein [Gammaproteobacteria bacterium]MBU4004158.1 GspE/PulE family protein [Gammaproteobacteria bacterium]MBU4020405.1 GspE/PulE family protein [Gammaproteobacteria bacterium]
MNAPLTSAVLNDADYPIATLPQLSRLTPAFDRLPLAEAQARRCALFRDGQRLVAVFDNPLAADVQRWVEARAGDPVEWRLANADDLTAWLRRQEQSAPALAAVVTQKVGAGETAERGEDISLARIGQNTSPVVRLVNATIHNALKLGASDIHLEATRAGLDIRFRIDGVLEKMGSPAGREMAEQAVSRLKVLAELDIAERRVPQDGRFPVRFAGRSIDLRVSIMPSIHGEDAVLRILDKRSLVPEGEALRLEGLGFAAADLARMRALATQPYGMLLVTGPTGSGKTTTLYGVLSEIHNGRDKIVTIEDPVEYELPGVLQIPVNDKKGLSFARGLRSILRHDPDKIMIGEIRDAETAEIAVQSALTGHLVLSTVHANHVFDVFSRFAHMGIDPYSLTSALNGVWAQRLLRTVCPHCAESVIPSSHDIATLNLSAELAAGDFRQGKGCNECRGTGYRGRRAVAEILALDDRLRFLIAQRAPLAEIKSEARLQGTRSLRDAALQLACAGQTTLEEVARVTLQH